MNPAFHLSADPYVVLGIEPGADDEAIRAAYLARLKLYPPDRAPDEFQRVREAYEQLRDRRQRARLMLFSAGQDQPLASLLDSAIGGAGKPRYAGPAAWLAVLQGK
ncbi:MAG: J domain-containing protein [Acidobacteriota bacterium]